MIMYPDFEIIDRWCFRETAAVCGVQKEDDIERLLEEGSGLVRHRGKIASAISNAKLVLDIQAEHGSLASYLWGFLPEGRAVINEWKCVLNNHVMIALTACPEHIRALDVLTAESNLLVCAMICLQCPAGLFAHEVAAICVMLG